MTKRTLQFLNELLHEVAVNYYKTNYYKIDRVHLPGKRAFGHCVFQPSPCILFIYFQFNFSVKCVEMCRFYLNALYSIG